MRWARATSAPSACRSRSCGRSTRSARGSRPGRSSPRSSARPWRGPAVKLGRLDPRRDLTYVKDTVAGFVAIAGCDAALGRAVNIGRGEDISIGDLVEMIGRRLGRPIAVETDQERYRPAASEVERLLAGTALAQSLWGWKPRYSLEEGLDETIALGARPSRPVPGRVVHDLTRRRCQSRDGRLATLDSRDTQTPASTCDSITEAAATELT